MVDGKSPPPPPPLGKVFAGILSTPNHIFVAWLDVYHHEDLQDKNEPDKIRWINFAKQLKMLHRINKTGPQCKKEVKKLVFLNVDLITARIAKRDPMLYFHRCV